MSMSYFRPSTIARLIEDAAIDGAKAVGTGAQSAGRSIKRLGHAISLEYQARQFASHVARLNKVNAAYEAMNDEQRAAHDADVRAVMNRASELLNRRASRDGSEATE